MFKYLIYGWILFCINTLTAEVYYIQPTKDDIINKTLIKTRAGDTISLAPGVYRENIVLQNNVTLFSAEPFAAEIIGDSRKPVITFRNGSQISGLAVSGGRNGILANNVHGRIENCYIHSNKSSGILLIGQLPDIHNSIISNNLNAGIQVTMLSSNGGSLSHLTIAENRQAGIDVDITSGIIQVNNCIFYRNGTKAIKTAKPNEIILDHTLIYPEQREFTATEGHLRARPLFVKRHRYTLEENSPGKRHASNGKDIGASQ